MGRALTVAVVTLVACTLFGYNPRVVRSRKLLGAAPPPPTFVKNYQGIDTTYGYKRVESLYYDKRLDNAKVDDKTRLEGLYSIQHISGIPHDRTFKRIDEGDCGKHITTPKIPHGTSTPIAPALAWNAAAGCGTMTDGDYRGREDPDYGANQAHEWPRRQSDNPAIPNAAGVAVAGAVAPAFKFGHFECWLKMSAYDPTWDNPNAISNALRKNSASAPTNGLKGNDIWKLEYNTTAELAKAIADLADSEGSVRLSSILNLKKSTKASVWYQFAWEGLDWNYGCHPFLKKLLPALLEAVLKHPYSKEAGKHPLITPFGIKLKIDKYHDMNSNVKWVMWTEIEIQGTPLNKLSHRELYYAHPKVSKEFLKAFNKKEKEEKKKKEPVVDFADVKDIKFPFDVLALNRLRICDMVYAEGVLPYLSEGFFVHNGSWKDRKYPKVGEGHALPNGDPNPLHYRFSMVNGDPTCDFRYLFQNPDGSQNLTDPYFGYYRHDGEAPGSIKRCSLVDLRSRIFRPVGNADREFFTMTDYSLQVKRISYQLEYGSYRNNVENYITIIPDEYKLHNTKKSFFSDITSCNRNKMNKWVSEETWAILKCYTSALFAREVYWKLTEEKYPGGNAGWFDEEFMKTKLAATKGFWAKTSFGNAYQARKDLIKDYIKYVKTVFDPYDAADLNSLSLKRMLDKRNELYKSVERFEGTKNQNCGCLRFKKSTWPCTPWKTTLHWGNNCSCLLSKTFGLFCRKGTYPHDPELVECEANRIAGAEITAILRKLGPICIKVPLELFRQTNDKKWRKNEDMEEMASNIRTMVSTLDEFFWPNGDKTSLDSKDLAQKVKKLKKGGKSNGFNKTEAQKLFNDTFDLIEKHFKKQWKKRVKQGVPDYCWEDEPLTPLELDTSEVVIKEVDPEKAIVFYKVIKGTKQHKTRGEYLQPRNSENHKDIAENVMGPTVGQLIKCDPSPCAKKDKYIGWRDSKGKKYYLPIYDRAFGAKGEKSFSGFFSRGQQFYLEKVPFTIGTRILLKNGKNATVQSIDDGKIIVKTGRGRIKTLGINDVDCMIRKGIACKILLKGDYYGLKGMVLDKTDNPSVWKVQLLDGRTLIMREADIEMLAGPLEWDTEDESTSSSSTSSSSSKSKDKKAKDAKKRMREKMQALNQQHFAQNQQQAMVANMAAMNAMHQQQQAGALTKSQKLFLVIGITILLGCILVAAYLFMGSEPKEAPRGDIESRGQSVDGGRRYRERLSCASDYEDRDRRPRASHRRSRSQPRRESRREKERRSKQRRSRSQQERRRASQNRRDSGDYERDERKSRHSRVSQRERL